MKGGIQKLFLIVALVFASATFSVHADINDNLVAHWELEGNYNDSSGNSNTLDNVGNIIFGEGYFGQGAVFEGNTGQLLGISNSLGYDTGSDMTWSFWIKLDSNSSAYIFDARPSDSGNRIIAYYDTTDSNEYGYLWASGNDSGPAIVPVDEWFLLTYTTSGGTVKMYVNGILSVSTSYGGISNYQSNLLNFGSSYDGGGQVPAMGKIDDIKVWTRVLTDEEILSLVVPSTNGGEPSSNMPNFIASSSEQFYSTTGFTMQNTIGWAGENIIKVFLGYIILVVYSLRGWIITILMLSGIIYFAYRAFRFYKH